MASKTRTRKPRLNRSEIQAQALRNALAERSVANYETIFNEFAEKGVPAEDVKPRENVFSYNAWLALGRQVRKGESGVKIVTWIERKAKTSQGEAESQPCKFPRSVTVFHISQTDQIQRTATA